MTPCFPPPHKEGRVGMRKIVAVLVSVILAVGLLFFGSFAGDTGTMSQAQAQTVTATSAQPNIVFILTDDMRKDDLRSEDVNKLLRPRSSGSTRLARKKG